MSKLVCNGAMCKCSFGSAPCPLMVQPTTKVKTQKMLNAANVKDKDIKTFVMCSSPSNPSVAAANGAPQPCSPQLLLSWLPGSPNVRVEGKPALTNDCRIFCAYAGLVTVENPGQQNINSK